ncbi:MAG TPA: cytidylate kinase-like family protein [Gemmatimonadaceae bacterium]|nr:cytidylate kinase-like family protein [Gemmatimonadaceae bacterium]
MPVITVSRMFGSGGSILAADLARTLGWTLVDSAFVEGVAQRLGTTPASVEAMEERLPSLAERLADAFAFGSTEVVSASLGTPMPPTEQRLLEMTRHVIDDTLARGPAVLVGRGAQSYLRERQDALHVLCCAPHEALVERVMQREGVSREQADALVVEKNRQRHEYVRQHWQREWLAPVNYHLCVNTGWLGLDGALELVVRLARDRFELRR